WVGVPPPAHPTTFPNPIPSASLAPHPEPIMASLLTLTFSQPTLTLAPGDVLIKEGDRGGDMYVLESGRLRVERDGVTLATISSAGALIGEMSVLLGTENTATVRAETAVTLRIVKDALAYLERQPLVALR